MNTFRVYERRFAGEKVEHCVNVSLTVILGLNSVNSENGCSVGLPWIYWLYGIQGGIIGFPVLIKNGTLLCVSVFNFFKLVCAETLNFCQQKLYFVRAFHELRTCYKLFAWRTSDKGSCSVWNRAAFGLVIPLSSDTPVAAVSIHQIYINDNDLVSLPMTASTGREIRFRLDGGTWMPAEWVPCHWKLRCNHTAGRVR